MAAICLGLNVLRSAMKVDRGVPARISNHTPIKMCGEITYPFPNFNGATVEVWEWVSNLTPHFTMDVITYPCWD